MEKWEVIGSRYVYESPYGSLRLDSCRLPTGAILDEYNVCEYPQWADIVALNDKKELILVKQYRHGIGDFSLELVAGCVDSDESPTDAIIRELHEEAGYACLSAPILLGKFHCNPARQNNFIYLFFCDNICKKYEQKLDDTEEIEVIYIPFDKVDDLIASGAITQLSSVTAIKLAQEYIRNESCLKGA